MMRPNIVRADTIDLQDPGSPSAADHSKQTPSHGLAPHQASEVNHIIEERHSEEQALAEAWNITHSLTSDEPGAVDQAQVDHLHSHERNGNGHIGEEGAEGGEAGSDGEDDMMDRISSSPSIDDGVYYSYSSPPTTPRAAWPDRKSSLSPKPSNPPRETFNKSASSSPDSSPFLYTPEHLPLLASVLSGGRSPSIVEQSDASPSPCAAAGLRARNISLVAGQKQESPSTSTHHHHMGRYERAPESTMERIRRENDHIRDMLGLPPRQAQQFWEYSPLGSPSPASDSFEQKDPGPGQCSTTLPARRSIQDLKSPTFDKGGMVQSPSLSSIQSVDLESILLPANDPLLDRPPSPTGSDGSWESFSDTDSGIDEGDADDTKDDDDDDDDAHDAFIDLEDRFIDSGWGGECLQEIEDIDFEFVYALHTFVATVEGQANATKGDTMVLLDDSNSYWWLVRIVKDNSIGYLPAEHIETPTERLARLNKHRNIDLSATMLSDNSEKPMNPLKKAMRRRNAKQVQFAAPTYVEASDNDYSTEDEDQVLDPYSAVLENDDNQQHIEPAVQIQQEPEEIKEPQVEKRSSTSSNRASFDREQAAMAAQALAEAGVISDDDPQTAPKLIDKTEAAPLKSPKGRTRNTDSFLKDDTIETRKITLTPGLLREETGSPESPIEQSRGNSFDSLTKVVSPSDSSRKDGKDKKKEPKKGGMFSGLFKSKKKDKKSKEASGDNESEKQSVELGRESPKESVTSTGKTSPVDRMVSGLEPVQESTASSIQPEDLTPVSAIEAPQDAPVEGFIAELPGSEVAYEMATGHEDDIAETHLRPAQAEKRESPLAPITNILHKESKPPKAKRSKQRVQLDDFDSPPADMASNPFDDPLDQDEERLSDSPVEISAPTFMHGTESIHIPVVDPDATDDEPEEETPASLTSSPSIIDHPSEPSEEGDGENIITQAPTEDSDPTPTGPRSPEETSPAATRTISPTITPISTSTSTSTITPSIVQQQQQQQQPTVSAPPPTSEPLISRVPSISSSSVLSQQGWSDGHLRAWLDESTEIRDMLVIIHDKTGVTPVTENHPIMSGLYDEPRKGVQDMMGRLDGLLGGYLERKGVQF